MEGTTKIQAVGMNLCLDPGPGKWRLWRAQWCPTDLLMRMFSPSHPLEPANGVQMKIQICNEEPCQMWFYTSIAGKIALQVDSTFYSSIFMEHVD